VPLNRTLRAVWPLLGSTTVLASLLLYFGYVSSAAFYGYFGVDNDVIGFSPQGLILRSVHALFAPILLTGLVGTGTVWLHRWLILRQEHSDYARRMCHGFLPGGLVLLANGLAGVAMPALGTSESMGEPLSLGLGAVLILAWLTMPTTDRRILGVDIGRLLPAVSAGVAVLSLFWTVSEYAHIVGRTEAVKLSRHLDIRPGLVVDSAARLFPVSPGILETRLPPDSGPYHYRYRGLRLLVAGHDRLYLIPQQWNPEQGAVLALNQSNDIRIEYYAG
jgi:hypothetical protein